MSLSSSFFYCRSGKRILWSKNSILTIRPGKLLHYCNSKLIISKNVILKAVRQEKKSTCRTPHAENLFLHGLHNHRLVFDTKKYTFSEVHWPRPAVMLRGARGLPNSNANTISFWVFSRHVECMLHCQGWTRDVNMKNFLLRSVKWNTKCQRAHWSFCASAEC